MLALELGTCLGEIIYWYESLSNEEDILLTSKILMSKKYKEILWDKIEDTLEIAGYEVDKIKLELIEGSKIVHSSRKDRPSRSSRQAAGKK